MKRSLLNICVGCLILCSCQHEKNNEKKQANQKYTVININNAIKKPTDIFLSDVAADIEYIKPEFTQNSMIKELGKVYITNDFIFLQSLGGAPYLMQFDRKGKFIRQVGNIGKGPGEYILCRNFTINEKDELVLVYTNYQDKILFYNFEGEFQFSLDITDAIGEINSLNTDEIIYRSAPGNRFNGFPEPFKLLIVNYKGDTIFYESSSFYKNFKCRYSGGRDIFYTLNDSFFIYEYFNDTIYLFNNKELSPAYTILWDKYKDIELFHPKITNIAKHLTTIFNIEQIQATNQNIYIYCYQYHTTDYFGIFDKKTGALRFSKSKYPEGCIKNDYDGGLAITPSFEASNKKWVASFRADSLMTTLTPEFLRNSPAKYPEKKDELKRFVSNLNENDNPVLMVVTLK